MVEEDREKRAFLLTLTTEAQSHIHHGKKEQALECYEKILEKYPKEFNAMYGKAMTFFEFGEFEQALDSFEEILLEDPNNIDTLYAKGTLLLRLKRAKESLEHLNKVLSLNKNYYLAWLARGFTLLELEQFNESLESFDKALKIGDNDSINTGKGHALRKLKRFKEAQEKYQLVLGNNPYDSEALFGLGMIEYELQNLKKSQELLSKSVIQDENNLEAWKTLVKIFKSRNDPKGEKVALEKIKELTKN